MADIRVAFVARPHTVSSLAQITHAGDISPEWTWSRDQVIASILAGAHTFYVVDPRTGRRSELGTGQLGHGEACLCTYADGVWNDDLLWIPYIPIQEGNASERQSAATLGDLIASVPGWAWLLGAGALGIAWVQSGRTEAHRICGACGKAGHDRRTCPFDGPRVDFSRAIPRSQYCECCERHGETQRHHARGRSDTSAFLDVCRPCHLYCCHGGSFQNLPIAPRYCRL